MKEVVESEIVEFVYGIGIEVEIEIEIFEVIVEKFEEEVVEEKECDEL